MLTMILLTMKLDQRHRLECPARTEQPFGQFAPFKDQFFQRFVDVAVFDDDGLAIMTLICGKEGRFAHQLANKRRADALGLIDQLWQMLEVQCQALSVQIKQPPAAATVW